MIDYFAAFTNTNGSAFPDTLSINASGAGATDGTEVVKLMVDDIWGFNQALLDYTDDTPDLSTEVPGASQRLDSILKIASNITTVNANGTHTVEEWDKKGVVVCNTPLTTLALAAGTGTDQTNRVLVYNQTGATITVTGAGTVNIADGKMVEFVYDDTSAFARLADDFSKVSINAITDANYIILDNDVFESIEVTKTTASGSNTVTLPLAANNTGRKITVKLIQGSTGFADYLIIDGNGAETIDGETVFHLNGDGDFIDLYCNGTEWKKRGFQASYEITSWVNRDVWENAHIGSNTTKNVDSNVTHNLNVPMYKTRSRLFISTDGTDNNGFEAFYVNSTGTDASGYVLYQIDVNNIKIQSGLRGLLYLDDAGNIQTIQDTTNDWYYRAIVIRER